MRGALVSTGSTPYFFADLCQELDTASNPGGGVVPSATEQTCSACPAICRASLQAAPRVPSPHLVHDGHALATARRPVSDRGAKRAVAAKVPRLLEAPRTPQKSIVKAALGYITRRTPAIAAGGN